MPTFPDMSPGIREDALDPYGLAATLRLPGMYIVLISRCLSNEDADLTSVSASAIFVLLTSCGQRPASLECATQAASATHAGFWGFARVVQLEQPSLRLHIASTPAHPSLALILSSCLAGCDLTGQITETQLAWHAGERHAPRLRRGALLASSKLGKDASSSHISGSFVITGGLGGLGMNAARVLFAQGARCVTLASRSGCVARDGQGLEAQLAGLQSTPSTFVQLVACDVGSHDEVLLIPYWITTITY